MSSQALDRGELLKDSEATLREVAGVLMELWDDDDGSGRDTAAPGAGVAGQAGAAGLGELIGVLIKSYKEINSVLDGLKNGRGVLQKAAMKRVQKTHAKLEEVSQTTEVAATDMLDGLDHALSLVDVALPMDAPDITDNEERQDAANQLRDELHRLIILLQFQDITAQQLAHATGVLAEAEERLEVLTSLFDMNRLDPNNFMGLADSAEKEDEEDEVEIAVEAIPTYDPQATTEGAEDRQALADDIFA